MRALVLLSILLATSSFVPEARACSSPPNGASFVRPTPDGFVYVPLPREHFVITVRNGVMTRVPVQLGMTADVSPDGRWLASWKQDYTDDTIGAMCMATGGQLWIYDLHQPRSAPQRTPMVWERESGLDARSVRFTRDGEAIEVRYVDPANDDTTRWYTRRGRNFRPSSAPSSVELQPRTERDDPFVVPATGAVVATHPAGLRAVRQQDALVITAADQTLRITALEPPTDPSADEGPLEVEDAEFSLDGRTLIVAYAAREEMSMYESYTHRGFVAVRVDTGVVVAAHGARPAATPSGLIDLRCGHTAADTSSPLAVRAAPRGRAPRVGALPYGTAVDVLETRGRWSRLAEPAGWVFSERLAQVCRPVNL